MKYSRIQDAHLKLNKIFKYYLSIAGTRKRVPRIPPQVGERGGVWRSGTTILCTEWGRGLPLLCSWYKDHFGEEPEYIKTAN